MAARSVPVVLNGTTYHLRFTRADIKAIENLLGVGYHHFVRPGIFGSLTATEGFLWRGLYREDKTGNLTHAFEQTDDGRELAGDLFWDHTTTGGEPVDDTLIEAFIASGLFRRKDEHANAQEDDPKNPT